MPDGNAAAQRVLAIGKSLKPEYEVSFLGITHGSNYQGQFAGFNYVNLPYPSSRKAWLEHLRGDAELQYIKNTKPDVVIAYNFPAWGLWRIANFCKKNAIKIFGDITEWYESNNILKWIDTSWRMRSLNKKMDGIIVISSYLNTYYKGCNCYLMPPTVDNHDAKWSKKVPSDYGQQTTLLYAGSPGRDDKDRLDNLIRVLINHPSLLLNVVGVTKATFCEAFPEVNVPENVVFHGRQTHANTIAMLVRSDFSIFFRRSSRVNNAGFPTKFVEAQSAGIPVISSHFSDLDQYVEEGKNGFLARSISAESIEEVLSRVEHLTRQQIHEMHDYTSTLNRFDYRLYAESLNNFVKNAIRK